MSNLQQNRPNPHKPSIVKRHGIWLARVEHPRDGHLVAGAFTLPDAYALAERLGQHVESAQ